MTLLEPPNSLAEIKSWFAIQVKATHEKRVASMLDYSELEWLLPLYESRRPWRDRIKRVELPLFPGYIFCRFGPADRVPILKTPSVTCIVGFGYNPIPIDEREIIALQTIVKSRASVSPHPFLQVGYKVRIDGGGLRGLEGFITDLRRRDRLIVSVTLLQRSVAVEIDSAWVTPIQTSKFPSREPKPMWASV